MKKYEYMITKVMDKGMDHTLNEYGNDGWMLVQKNLCAFESRFNANPSNVYELTFVREKEELGPDK